MTTSSSRASAVKPPDADISVRRCHSQRPTSVSHSYDFASGSRIRCNGKNISFPWKRWIHLYRSNSTTFVNVPTPTSVHHLMHVC
jgi:hypothetical protein